MNPFKFLALLSTLSKWLERAGALLRKSVGLARFDAAAKKAEEKKDTSDLENLFGRPPGDGK